MILCPQNKSFKSREVNKQENDPIICSSQIKSIGLMAYNSTRQKIRLGISFLINGRKFDKNYHSYYRRNSFSSGIVYLRLCGCEVLGSTSKNFHPLRSKQHCQINFLRPLLSRYLFFNIYLIYCHFPEYDSLPLKKYTFQNCTLHAECNDPIFRCFDLAKSATKLANKTPEYRSEYEDVAK